MDLSVIATVLGSASVAGTGLNAWLQRRDTNKRSDSDQAFEIYKEQTKDLRTSYDDLKKDYTDLKKDVAVEREVRQREMSDLTHKHHICEEGRKALEIQVEVLKMRVDRDAGGSHSS